MSALWANRASDAIGAAHSLFTCAKTCADCRDSVAGMGGVERCRMADCPALYSWRIRRMGLLGAWWTPLFCLRTRLSFSAHDVAPRADYGAGDRQIVAGCRDRHWAVAPRSVGADIGHRDFISDAHKTAHWDDSFDLYLVGSAACAVGPGL